MSIVMSKRLFLASLAASVLALNATTSLAQDKKTRSYILATATTGGTYYPVGVAIATLMKVKLEPKEKVSMSAIASAGSGENVKLLRENQAQFAILQGLFGAWAWTGTGQLKADGPQKNLRSIASLWQNIEHFVVTADLAKTGTMDDLQALKGKKFSIGARNSGTEGSGRTILAGLGIDTDKHFDVVYMGYTPSADAFQNGTISGMNLPGGTPVTAVTQTLAKMGDKARVLDFTDAQVKRSNSALGIDLWTRYVIPPNTYPGQSKPINTVGQPNYLAVRADVDEDAVYLITKTMWENLPFLNNIHKATTAMKLEAAIDGLPFPLHPGAAKYYKEKGLKIPQSLLVTK
jgi:TRAP transporter TAXI family solute receptor